MFQQLVEKIIDPEFSQSIREVGKAIYTELSMTRGLDAFDEKLYAQALQMAAGQREVNGQLLGGIQEIRGLPTFIMPNQTADKYEMALQRLSVEDIQKATGQTIDPEYLGKYMTKKYKIRHNDEGGDVYYIEYLEDN